MVLTIVIEISLLLYTVWRYKLNKLSRLVSAMVLLLAVFQLAEFRVCRGDSGLVQWSHLGYVAITLLPPLGIHIIKTIQGKKDSVVVYASYTTAAAFITYFALTANSLGTHACLGNYVIFQINSKLTWVYAVYYYGWVITGLLTSLYYAERSKAVMQKQAMYCFVAGYCAFLLPTTTVNLIDRATLDGIPSIMCGFAVLFAVITVIWVMPRVGTLKRTRINKKPNP